MTPSFAAPPEMSKCLSSAWALYSQNWLKDRFLDTRNITTKLLMRERLSMVIQEMLENSVSKPEVR